MNIRPFVATALIAVAFSISLSAPAWAQCPEFPDVEIWGNISHQSVTNYVNRKLGGDWDAYADRLTKILTRLEDLHSKGKAVIVKMKGKRARFRGEALA